MGNCLGGNEDTSRNAEASDSSLGGHRRNQPLRPEKPKWKSDIPLTDGQLRSKRDEFWDTAPAFEGRKEIWDALKAASYALETNDRVLAQAIIDGASISLPTGNLTECYDELGNRYQLPVYVLNSPANLIEEGSDADTTVDTDSEIGCDVSIKFRLSSGKDFKMTVRSTDNVLKIKRRIQQEEGLEVNRQRWFFSGKVLNDKLRIEDAKIPKGFVVQIIVAPSQLEKPPPVSS